MIEIVPCSCTNPDNRWLLVVDNRSTGITFKTKAEGYEYALFDYRLEQIAKLMAELMEKALTDDRV